MADKLQVITELAKQTQRDVTESAESWMSFLKTAAQNYKYSFRDQLLIYAQKPDATACAEIETWNKLGRWVNRGTKGIALLADSSAQYRLRHVFDVSDTNSRDGYEVYIWQMSERNEAAVTEALQNSFGDVEANRSLDCVLAEISDHAVDDNISDYLSQLVSVKNGSFLEELDELNIGVVFKNTLKSSVAFLLLSRCGYDAKKFFEADDFRNIINFGTPETVSVIGTAAGDISRMILKEISETVRNQNRTFAKNNQSIYTDAVNKNKAERSTENGNDLHETRGLSPARPYGTERAENRQIRKNEAELSQGEPGSDLHRDAHSGNAEFTSGTDGQAGERNARQADERTGGEVGRDGEPQGKLKKELKH